MRLEAVLFELSKKATKQIRELAEKKGISSIQIMKDYLKKSEDNYEKFIKEYKKFPTLKEEIEIYNLSLTETLYKYSRRENGK